MSVLRWPAVKPLLLLLCLSLLISACSRAGLAYRNLDWLVPWRLNDYLNLDSQQQAWLKPRLQTHLQWHCSAELPRYIDWLQTTESILAQPQPDSAQLLEQFAQFDAALKRIGVEITPTAIELLQGLSEQQVNELYSAMDEDNLEDRQDFLDPPLATQISERQTRMQERLRPWLGRLNSAQTEHIATWANSLGEQNRLWLENRQLWQAELRKVVAERDSVDFAERLTPLLQQRERFYSDEYRASYGRSRQALATLFSHLLSNSDEAQRERLSHRLRDLRRDLAEQQCDAA
ncbi:hypothetical protein DBR00_16400 [Pseudomonas sp. HMWF032]|uniref:DUF6279 family lipoprotein n=1 Tax=Pseudomonas sp. HMWF032 TaxID=2056866 RepID=UPI000D385BAB|nr:DUF6279 family lipoprotein [Pseudomonas sp. HMWF032]PTS82700.1 hypothetical protein DBR00_16400 [Pseudomonas sp. HMWF032]PTT83408.1 hypothetical protein DBR41_10820 [Pseudomonas sp. HMWF010]